MNTVMILTITSIFLVIYHHVGYPILLKLIRRWSKAKPVAPINTLKYAETPSSAHLPFFSIVMPAYNEERYIAEKIRNLALLDYPSDRFEVVLASDGSTDRTVEVARAVLKEEMCESLPLKIFDFKKNLGKMYTINSVVPKLKGELVALTDVSALISMDALLVAAKRFEDKTVGGINGNYRLIKPGSPGEEAYWRYQSNIKLGEEKLGSVLGAHGSCYFIRKSLFKRLPNDTINDDFIIPMKIVEQGYRIVHDQRLNSVELESAGDEQDWRRRLRISFGNAQQIALLKKLFSPRYRGVAFAFFSGKGLRILMPFLMIISLAGSYLLVENPLFALSAIGQTLIYLGVIIVHFSSVLRKIKPLNSMRYIVVGHIANLIGCLQYLVSKKTVQW